MRSNFRTLTGLVVLLLLVGFIADAQEWPEQTAQVKAAAEQLEQAIAKQRAMAIVQEQPEPEEAKAVLEKLRRAIAKQRAKAALEELRRLLERLASHFP